MAKSLLFGACSTAPPNRQRSGARRSVARAKCGSNSGARMTLAHPFRANSLQWSRIPFNSCSCSSGEPRIGPVDRTRKPARLREGWATRRWRVILNGCKHQQGSPPSRGIDACGSAHSLWPRRPSSSLARPQSARTPRHKAPAQPDSDCRRSITTIKRTSMANPNRAILPPALRGTGT